MPGSKADVTALKAAYETVGFDVQIHTDCNAQVKRTFLFFRGLILVQTIVFFYFVLTFSN